MLVYGLFGGGGRKREEGEGGERRSARDCCHCQQLNLSVSPVEQSRAEMAVTAHLPSHAQQPPLLSHPIVSSSSLPLPAQLLLAQQVHSNGTASWSTIDHNLASSTEWPDHDAGKLTPQASSPPSSPSHLPRRDRLLTILATAQGYHEAFREIMLERGLDPCVPSSCSTLPSRR